VFTYSDDLIIYPLNINVKMIPILNP
jgi:hypothetical protein